MKNRGSEYKILTLRILRTIAYLMLFILGTKIVPPLYDLSAINSIDKGVMAELLSYTGASIGTFSLFTLGVTPVLISSMVMQLLAMGASPSLKKALKTGKITAEKFDELTKLCFLLMSFMSSFAIIYSYNQQYQILLNQTLVGYGVAIITMVCGALACNFIANQITNTGIANGVSLIILTSIANSAFQDLATKDFGLTSMLVTITLLLIICFAVATSVKYPLIFIMNAGHCETEYAIQLDCAGIMPIIVSQMVVSFVPANYQLIALYVLIAIFTIVYTFSSINAIETAKGLQRANASLAGFDKESDMCTLLKKEAGKFIVYNIVLLYVLLSLPTFLEYSFKISLLLPCITMLVLCSISASVLASFDAYIPSKKVNKILNT